MNFRQSPPAFPDVKTFGELFSQPEKRTSNVVPHIDFGSTKHRILCSMHVRNGNDMPDCFYYFNVRPNEKLCQWIASNMLALDRDSIYFEAILFKSGAVIYAKYNQILGSRVIGAVSLESFPTEKQIESL